MAFAEEIGVCGGHSSSGVLSNINGATNIKGLYVAGDVDGGLPHSYLGGALAMGSLIGEKAAAYVLNNERGVDPSGLKSWINKEIAAFEKPLKRDRGLPTDLVECKVRTKIQNYLKPPKNPGYMERAVWWMERMRAEDLPEVMAEDYHDLLKVYEIGCILTVGEMMARASIFREESRWGYQHWRTDVPMKKPEWDGQWVVIRKGSSGMELFRRRVPPLKWNYPTAMEYSHPELSFDVGKPFEKGPNWRNPERDQWMEAKLQKQGMKTPRKFMPRAN